MGFLDLLLPERWPGLSILLPFFLFNNRSSLIIMLTSLLLSLAVLRRGVCRLVNLAGQGRVLHFKIRTMGLTEVVLSSSGKTGI